MRRILEYLRTPFNIRCVVEVADGTDAVETMRQHKDRIDGVFLAHSMPHLSGALAAQYIREEIGFDGPIIGITGSTVQSEIQNFRESGAGMVLIKPLVLSSVEAVLRSICGRPSSDLPAVFSDQWASCFHGKQ